MTVRKIQELYLQWHIVSFVTSRILYDDYKTEELTREFLLSHWLKDTLHFSENKWKTCNDEKIDLFVDDWLHNLKSILSISPETTCYTVDKPWNREKEIERVWLTTEEVTKIIRLRSLSLLKV